MVGAAGIRPSGTHYAPKTHITHPAANAHLRYAEVEGAAGVVLNAGQTPARGTVADPGYGGRLKGVARALRKRKAEGAEG